MILILGSRLCRNCHSDDLEYFYKTSNVPVNSVIQVQTRKEALTFPKGDIHLTHCGGCGLIFNSDFDASLAEYSDRYESTQRHSGTFSRFNEALADELIARHDLNGKKIIEIGCGEGEFLYQLCRKGNNTGLGFDPACRRSELNSDPSQDVSFVQDYYSERYAGNRADFYVCKMTLEHIQDVGKFLGMIRGNIGTQKATVFFQVPNFEKSLREGAFWDVYYEHCSYFTSASIEKCFEYNGFAVRHLWDSFEKQYLMLEAEPQLQPLAVARSSRESKERADLVKSFRFLTEELRGAWSRKLSLDKRSGKETVIWGASSKGVSFLTTMETAGIIDYAVDINPNKRGMFIPGTGQEIVGPQDMRDIRPDMVIVMNPVYTEEIRNTLMEMNLSPTIVSIEKPLT